MAVPLAGMVAVCCPVATTVTVEVRPAAVSVTVQRAIVRSERERSDRAASGTAQMRRVDGEAGRWGCDQGPLGCDVVHDLVYGVMQWAGIAEHIAVAEEPGRRRSPATLASFHEGRTPHNKGLRYPPDPPTVEEIITVMRAAGEDADGVRLRALIIVLWRAGLRISEALALAETDLDPGRGAILVRQGKGGKRREVGMDRWAWEQLQPWIELRKNLPVGAFFCILHGSTRGRPCGPAGMRAQLHRIAATAGVRRRFASHQLRHAHAVEMSREGVPLVVIQRQLGHADLGVTSAYLRGIDNTEIIHTVHERPTPMIPATAGLTSDT